MTSPRQAIAEAIRDANWNAEEDYPYQSLASAALAALAANAQFRRELEYAFTHADAPLVGHLLRIEVDALCSRLLACGEDTPMSEHLVASLPKPKYRVVETDDGWNVFCTNDDADGSFS